MRIYEFSQSHNISSKDIIEKLQSSGFKVKSHMSVLDEKALALLNREYAASDGDIASGKSITKESVIQSSQPVNVIEKTVPESLSKATHLPQKTTIEKRQQKEKNSSFATRQNVKQESIKEVVEPSIMSFVATQMSVGEFAEKTKKPVTDVIVTLLKWGVMATRNQVISDAIVKRLAEHYEIPCSKAVAKKEAVDEGRSSKKTNSDGKFTSRPPVVVVVGHVDHGKTTLLDYIRKTRVALKEKGGITQHLGAYEAVTAHGNIVFLDTPGHEAFGKIRQRGIRVADLVVLVVAADDGVMPQTIEAIKHVQLMESPVIVALNKVDRVDAARIDVIKRQLSQHNIIVEDWGGDVICAPISAKFGTGVDHLLEMISLQSDMMELRAEIDVSASGYILESSLEKGRGPVATVITQNGVLKIGDYFSCGDTSGRISSLVDSAGQRIKEALPSIPVQVAGFDDRPEAGDFFECVSKDVYLKIKSSSSKNILHNKRFIYEEGINLVVKADNHSSLEAVVEGIDRLSKKGAKGFNVLRHSIGDVAEGDIEFAYNTGSRIVCFNVKTEVNAHDLADRKKVTISHYGIIYKLLEDLVALADEFKKIELVTTKIGEAVVLKVFDIKKVGVIAGSLIRDGRFSRDGFAVVWRGKSKIGEGKISSLQRDKKTVKEVATGFECAFMINGFNDWAIDDRVECFIDIPKK